MLNQVIQLYSNNATVRRIAPEHRDGIVITEYFDVTSPYLYNHPLQLAFFTCVHGTENYYFHICFLKYRNYT